MEEMEEVVKEFKKNKRQIQAVILASKFKYFMLYGGSRSGKTFIAVFMIIVRACKVKSKHIIFRQTFASASTSIWLDTIPEVMRICFPYLEYKQNKSKYYITLPNGSEIWVAGLDDGKRIEKHLGRQFSTIYFNETSEIPYSSITLIMTRLAEKNSLEKRMFFDSNPPRKSHWQYWLFEKNQDPIDEVPLENPEDYGSILMNPMDNIENIDADYLKMLDRLPEEERKRFRDGIYGDESEGEAYYAFDRDKHVKDIDLNIIENGGTEYIGMDFNVNPMTSVIVKYVNGVFYVYDEFFLPNSDTYKMTSALLKAGHKGTVIPDSTGKNRKTSGKSDHLILKEAGFQIPYVYNPPQSDRVNNINYLLTNGLLVISPRCKKLISDLEKVCWKNNRLDDGPKKQLGHISDALGYVCWKLKPLKEPKKKNKTLNI